MRPAKLIALIVGGLIALILIAAIVIPLVIDPNDYKERIAQEAKKATGRDLELKGDLKLSIFPWLAIETGPAELGNPAGFGAGPFVTLKSADVGVKLLPLLRGELEVRRLRIDGMQVNLIKNADGHTNWEDLSGEEGKTTETSDEGPASLKIAGLSIRDSSLDYRNLQDGTHQRLQDLQVETGEIGSGKPVDLKVGFKMDEGPDTASTAVNLKTQVAADTEQEQFNLKDLVLDVVHRAAEKDARELPISVRMPSLEADLKAQTLAVPQFAATAAGAELTGELRGEKIVDQPAIQGSIALKQTSLRELLTKLGQEAPKTRDPKAFDAVALTSKLKATDKSVTLDDLKLSLDGSMITGSAGVADLDKNSLRFDLKADRLDLDRYQAPEEESKSKGKEEPFELPVDLLKALDAKGTLSVGTLKLAGMTMSSVTVRLDAADGVVRVNPSEAKLFGGAQHGTVAIDARGPVAKLSLDQQLKGIDFATLFGELFQSQRMTGRGDAKAMLSARGNNMTDILASLDGRIDFNAANGALKGADLWYEIRRARALWKREAMPTDTSLGETRFKSLKGSAVVTQGVVENRDLIMDMDYLKVNGEGKLDLKSSKVDYRLTANVYEPPKEQQPAGTAAAAPSTDLADLRKAEIPVRVTGTLEDLKIRPDLEAVAKAQVKGKVEEKKEELQKKLSDKLSDWLGKKKP